MELPRDFSAYIRMLVYYRDLADYTDEYFATFEETVKCFDMLSDMLPVLEDYLHSQIKEHISKYGGNVV